MSDPIKYDMAWLRSASRADMIAARLVPEQREEINELLRTRAGAVIASEMLSDPDYVPVSKRQPDAEEAAAIVVDTAIADEQAAAAVAAEQSEADRLAAEQAAVAPVAPIVPVEKKKIVVDYQVTAEDGTPLGRPTHFEGWSNEEVIEKMKNAHINAMRYAERVKKNQAKSVEIGTQQKQVQEAAVKAEAEAVQAVEVASKEKDPIKLREAISKVSKAEREAQIAEDTAKQHGKIIAESWMSDHKEDFYPCMANNNIIGQWLKDNSREFSYDNLELAFKAKQTQLVKPEIQAPVEETSAPVVFNTPTEAPAVPAQAVIPAPVVQAAEPESIAVLASQPILTTPALTSVAAPIAQPATRRPGVNGSLAPGALTAGRPSGEQKSVVSTYAEMRAEIAKMPPEEFRRKLKSPQYVARLEAAGIHSVSQGT